MTNKLSEKIWDKFLKTSKIGPTTEGLIAECFKFSTKIIKSFVLPG